MDDWFLYHGVPKKEKLSHAIKQLTGSGYKWWKGVDGARWKSQREAIKTWKDLKEAMIRKYVSSLPSPEIRERYPRRFSSHGSKEAKRMVPQQGCRSLIYQDHIRQSQMPTVLYDQYQPYEVPKAMEKKNLVSQDTLARHKEKSDKPIFQEKAKKMDQDTKLSMLLKEAKPVIKVSHQVPRKEPDHKLSHEPTPKWKPEIEQCVVQIPRLKVAKKKASKKSHRIIFCC
ncbi:hypothetical protein F2Q69_00006985 [Brassica cretica]|uniref:Uncharacterized protein n=1 Tax=Brassica cretica TaxID=69181 RepID=A0A8S9PJW7_BRACR|nr:hypothetical protein F2Q69_00006985 [Brassica cretica]